MRGEFCMKKEVLIASGGMCSGLILMFLSGSWGLSLADSWLIANGGQAETNAYLMKRNHYFDLFFTTGSILFAGGLLFSILCYFFQGTMKNN
jgi:hypothetical protein